MGLSHYKKRIKELERVVKSSQRLVTKLTSERAALLLRGRAAGLALRQVAELLELAALLEEQQQQEGEEAQEGKDAQPDAAGGVPGATAACAPQRPRAARAPPAPLARFRQQLLALQADLHEIVTPEQEGCEEVSNSASGGAWRRAAPGWSARAAAAKAPAMAAAGEFSTAGLAGAIQAFAEEAAWLLP
jgi:hypothetical protein